MQGNLEEMLSYVSKNFLPKDLVNNYSFKALKEVVLNSFERQRPIFKFNTKILEELGVRDIEYGRNSLPDDFIMEVLTDKMDVLIDFFIVEGEETNSYRLLFIFKKLVNDLSNNIDIDLYIKDGVSTWKITESVTDCDDYYLSYNFDFYKFDSKNCEILNIDKERIKDENFSEFFSLPLKCARKYRTNFSKYLDYFKSSVIQNDLNEIDELYGSSKVQFTIPFEMEEFMYLVLSDMEKDEPYEIDEEDDEVDELYEMIDEILDEFTYEEEDNTYEEELEDSLDDIEEYDASDKAVERLSNIKEQIVEVTKDKGKFIMSSNLCYNLSNTLELDIGGLTINGYIINKIGDDLYLYDVLILMIK